ncbi:malate dehydrogenase (oxaloacetate-decarboxylating)(NADP+) [Nitratiruptor sp. YY08-26]|uniref:malic enzyme-like NAD(P)-binding protein n=1 Tax=unclassified Nitratiruptor TaxID=2624044 RepID=UPI0019158A18|nr:MULTISPECIES: malic enzyme-like NAD(P)-binding protein [unclassified Nitratiruptor]BCD62970.1 malate dehydrogenase (oxaloacetate-decarboxylating)(NADP+) [Nitratiruptor sp. YY08-13]BCD66905.1 malate dehydrogenase (oxaloacetate-decarboxylating)(NADP+) [Nitratiruptor sp. YY08-26]
MKITKEEVLSYHKEDKPGKKEIAITKSFETQKDLSIAYTPGVAYVCEEIAKNPEAAYDYTTKGNFVAVVTNGTAVLGLGDIGPLAAKPVMEGKAILFKKFAGINAVGILVDEKDPEKFIEIVRAISPTFGGINLEDIKAPECFYIEEKLKKITDIPVMHDDQHGTAIVTTAAMINACKLTNRDIASLKVVIVGSGAAAIASARMYRHLGVKEIILIDSKGVVHAGRTDLNPYKKEFALPYPMRREEAFNDADMVLGLSIPGAVQEEDIARMKDEPFVFVCSNPSPEIMPDVVRSIKPQAIIATGRSDFPNQVNNVLGFPFLFRGALDTRSSAINYEMMLTAANALAALARKDVPEEVKKIYNKDLFFSKEYIIPTPFDKRLLVEVSAAVAKAAMESGVARKVINIEEYKQRVATFI